MESSGIGLCEQRYSKAHRGILCKESLRCAVSLIHYSLPPLHCMGVHSAEYHGLEVWEVMTIPLHLETSLSAQDVLNLIPHSGDCWTKREERRRERSHCGTHFLCPPGMEGTRTFLLRLHSGKWRQLMEQDYCGSRVISLRFGFHRRIEDSFPALQTTSDRSVCLRR